MLLSYYGKLKKMWKYDQMWISDDKSSIPIAIHIVPILSRDFLFNALSCSDSPTIKSNDAK